jgi:hypothetical protein
MTAEAAAPNLATMAYRAHEVMLWWPGLRQSLIADPIFDGLITKD